MQRFNKNYILHIVFVWILVEISGTNVNKYLIISYKLCYFFLEKTDIILYHIKNQSIKISNFIMDILKN
jgi:hypothetical protein